MHHQVGASLSRIASSLAKRFPRLLGTDLPKGAERILANAAPEFLATCSATHLRSILIVQGLLQRQMEQTKEGTHPIFLKLFHSSERICIALCCSTSHGLLNEKLLPMLQTLLPGIDAVEGSAFAWLHPRCPYLFGYLEVYKLRGDSLSALEIKELEKDLHEQLFALPPSNPTLFWPYNVEESFRQIQLLQREISDASDLPHISVQFREQTPTSIEFVVHLVQPVGNKPLSKILEELPTSLDAFFHLHQSTQKVPFPIEVGSFSVKVDARRFNVRNAINLLYARRSVLKHLETVLGPFRDFNGGLFEKLQSHFEKLQGELKQRIPLFDLFAEKVFYAIYPTEARLTLSLVDYEHLFSAFSTLIRSREPCALSSYAPDVLIVKSPTCAELSQVTRTLKEDASTLCYARITLGNFEYLFALGSQAKQLSALFEQKTATPRSTTQVLRLIFQEGEPPSLNPHQSWGDMRCRMVCKLLFEGLTRLDKNGIPTLAGASAHKSTLGGRVHTFTLREHSWSNGEKVTAHDYVTSWQNALRDHVPHPELLYVIHNAEEVIKRRADPKDLGIKALNKSTLQITLDYPDPNFLHKLAQPPFFPIFGAMKEPNFFNGPFQLGKKNKDALVLERNPYFWDPKRPFFERVHISWFSEVEAIYSLFKRGATDWIGDPISILSPALINKLQAAGGLQRHAANRRFLLCFNTEHFLLSSSWIRRALSGSIDRTTLCKKIFPHCTPVAGESADPKELFNRGLEELGWTDKPLPTLEFTYSHQTGREQIALQLQATWKRELNLSIDIKKLDWNHFRNQLEKGHYQIAATIQDSPKAPSIEFAERFEGGASWNFSRWKHPAYRDLVQAAKQEKNLRRREALLIQAQEILTAQVPFTPLFNYTHLYSHAPGLEGYLIDEEGCVDFSSAYTKESL